MRGLLVKLIAHPCTTLIMVIRFAPNKSNQKVVEEQAVWRDHKLFNNNQHVKISPVTLKVSAVCTVQQYPSRSAKPPGSLVSGPHCNYKKAKEHRSNHQNCHYHKLCAAMFDNFVQTDADKFRDVRNALNSSRQKAVEENRNCLSQTIRRETVVIS